ncbi:hypothetical protein F2P81_013076, partial [Scophthalmus maximus]
MLTGTGTVRCALPLLGLAALAALGQALLAPPTVNVSLDEGPELRWKPLLQVFDVEFLRRAGAEVIDSTVPKWVHQALAPVVVALEKYIPPPYAGEIRGMASLFGGSLSDIVILNFAYEISAFCTSIVAQDKNGSVYHGRNLDYPHPVLRNLTVNVVFLKNGEVAYRGTSFAGYVGLWTGQSPHKFTVSGDQRGSDHWWNWWKNFVSAFLLGRTPVSWLVRETLVEAENFQDAVMRLSKIPIITGVYYIVGGVRAGEGVVITRDRKGPADIWPLDPVNGGHFLLRPARQVTTQTCGHIQPCHPKMLALINRLLDWFRSLFWKEEMELTLVGLQYSGKTTFVNVIASGQFSEDMIPTVGFNMRKVTKGNVTIKIWDIGGQPRFRSMWERYCRGVNAIVYMVDAADREKIEASRNELHNLLDKPQLQGIPVLVLGNKRDLPNALDEKQLIEQMNLSAIQDREICCYSVSCKKKDNI